MEMKQMMKITRVNILQLGLICLLSKRGMLIDDFVVVHQKRHNVDSKPHIGN
jgi:hypothetical protein